MVFCSGCAIMLALVVINVQPEVYCLSKQGFFSSVVGKFKYRKNCLKTVTNGRGNGKFLGVEKLGKSVKLTFFRCLLSRLPLETNTGSLTVILVRHPTVYSYSYVYSVKLFQERAELDQ